MSSRVEVIERADLPRLFVAHTLRDCKEVPAAEILAFYLQGPRLEFDYSEFASADKRAWHPELARDELNELRLYWQTRDGAARARIAKRACQLWRELVEHSIGYRWPGGELVRWPE